MQEAKRQFQIPEEVSAISRALSSRGFENYLVGGSVRDLIRKDPPTGGPKDWDIATSATPEEIQKVFPDSFYENQFGTVGVKTESIGIVEVTPYRLESEYSDARHPDKIEWANKLEDDLARRDFTMNAIALDINPKSQILNPIDPFGGQKDIEKKIIRTVGKP